MTAPEARQRIVDSPLVVPGPQAAKLIGLSYSHFCDLLGQGRVPAPIRYGKKCTRWRVTDLESYVRDPSPWLDGIAA